VPALKPLYDYAWFVGFLAAGGLYVLLTPALGRRAEPAAAPTGG